MGTRDAAHELPVHSDGCRVFIARVQLTIGRPRYISNQVPEKQIQLDAVLADFATAGSELAACSVGVKNCCAGLAHRKRLYHNFSAQCQVVGAKPGSEQRS